MKTLTTTELARLYDVARRGRRADYILVRLLYELGLRTIEVERMRLKDIEWTKDGYHVWIWGKQRDGYEDVVPITEDLVNLILLHYESRDRTCEWVLCGQLGEPLRTRSMRTIINKLFKQAGIRGHSAHHLRHTAATSLIRQGVLFDDVKQFMRHKSDKMTALYTKEALLKHD